MSKVSRKHPECSAAAEHWDDAVSILTRIIMVLASDYSDNALDNN
ncbi:hypothetical protein [Mesorhizobium sp. CO1-1-7]|nr:hypothetical protein [Mesorhizobium sp. CO1-1-7]